MGYVETKTRPSGTFSSTRLIVVAAGKCALNAATAWLTSATRSARKSTRLTQPRFMSWSTNEITVRVLPEPVAMTSSASRRLASNDSPTARIARV